MKSYVVRSLFAAIALAASVAACAGTLSPLQLPSQIPVAYYYRNMSSGQSFSVDGSVLGVVPVVPKRGLFWPWLPAGGHDAGLQCGVGYCGERAECGPVRYSTTPQPAAGYLDL